MRKRIVLRFALVFFVLGLIGLFLRSIRNVWIDVPIHLFDLTDSNIVVAVEHLFAGIGVPAGIAAFLLSITLFGERGKPKFYWQLNVGKLIEGSQFYWSVIILSSFGYMWHIYEHEIRQTQEHGYWGTPYASINEWQVLVGLAGIIIFIVYAYIQSRHNNDIYWKK